MRFERARAKDGEGVGSDRPPLLCTVRGRAVLLTSSGTVTCAITPICTSAPAGSFVGVVVVVVPHLFILTVYRDVNYHSRPPGSSRPFFG